MDWAIDIAIKVLINLPSWDVMANYKRQYDDFKKLVQRVLSPGQAGPNGSRDANDGVAYAWPDSCVSTVLYNIRVYYYCDNQQGMGGNSTTGQVARKFFRSQNLAVTDRQTDSSNLCRVRFTTSVFLYLFLFSRAL